MGNHYVYLLIDPFTGQPFYVGKGRGGRMYRHTQPSQQQYNPIKANRIKSIVERGGDIEYDMIPFTCEQDAFAREQQLIIELGKLCNGTGILTNLDDGGRGGSSGRPITPEVRANLRARKRVQHTPQSRKQIGNAHSKPKTAAQKENLRAKSTTAKRVIQYDLNGTVLNEFRSAREASQHTGVDCTHIIHCCKGKYHTAKGFVWKFVTDIARDNGPHQIIQLTKQGEPVRVYTSLSEAARVFNTSVTLLSRACKNSNFTAVGYRWEFYSPKET